MKNHDQDDNTGYSQERNRVSASFVMVFGPEIYDKRLSHGARLLRMGISYRCAGNYDRNFVSYKTLAEDFDCDVRTIHRWITELKDCGIFKCEQDASGRPIKTIRATEDVYGDMFVASFRKMFSSQHRDMFYFHCEHLRGSPVPVPDNFNIDASTLANHRPREPDKSVTATPDKSVTATPATPDKSVTATPDKFVTLNRRMEVHEFKVDKNKETKPSFARPSFDEEKRSSLGMKKRSPKTSDNSDNLGMKRSFSKRSLREINSEDTNYEYITPSEDIPDSIRIETARRASLAASAKSAIDVEKASRRAAERNSGEGGAQRREAKRKARTEQKAANGPTSRDMEYLWRDFMKDKYPQVPVSAWTPARLKDVVMLIEVYSAPRVEALIRHVFDNWRMIMAKYKWMGLGEVPEFSFMFKQAERLMAELAMSGASTVDHADLPSNDSGIF